MRASQRLGITAIAALLSAACNGFPSAVPGEAEHAAGPEKYLTYQMAPETEPVIAGSQVFVFIAAPVTDIPIRAFGGRQGVAAPLTWDQAPFDRLYVVSQAEQVHAYGPVF